MGLDAPDEIRAKRARPPLPARALPLLLWAMPLGSTLAATPAIMRGLGAEAYGAYTIAMAVAIFAVLPSPGAAVARFRSGATDGSALAVLGRRVGALLIVAVLLNVILIAVPAATVALRPFLPTRSLQALVVLAIAWLVLSSVLSQLLLALLQARGRWSQGAMIALAASISAPIVAALIAATGAAWPLVMLGQASVLFGGFVALMAAQRGPSPGGSSAGGVARPSAIAGFMARTTLSSAIGALMAISERWLIGSRFGADTAGYFALAMSLALLVHAFVLALNIRLPGMLAAGRLHTGRDGLVPIYDRAVRISALAACLALALIVARGETFVRVWLGEQAGLLVQPYLIGLSISNFAMAMIVPAWMLAEATGNERANVALMFVLIGGWATAIALALVPLGAQAVVAGRLFALVAVPAAIVLIEGRALGSVRLRLWGRLLPRLALGAAAAVAASLLMPSEGLAGLLLGGALTALVYAAVTWTLGLWQLDDLQVLGS